MLAISIIVVFQIIIALPFVLTDTSVHDYMVRTKFTGAGRVTPSPDYWNFVASQYDHSIFWTFI